jgi:DNA-binding transcriptional MerR regulator
MLQAVINNELVTTASAARLAQRASETIRHWANTGRLPVAYRTDTGVRIFRREDVLRVARERASEIETRGR